MERIVSGIAKINFQQNCEDILVENRIENMTGRSNEMIPEPSSYARNDDKLNDPATDSDLESEFNSSSETAIVGDDDADSSCSGSSTTDTTLSQRRNLPRRACKENSLKLKRRSIMKPKRHTSRSCDFSMLRPAEIKKIYCNQKLTCFRRTNLETIFEEPQNETRRGDAAIANANTSLRLIGLRKIRRSISCSDGLNTNKTLIKQRRAKIKKVFGRRSVCKKISLIDFIDRLNKSFGDDADIEDAIPETDDNNIQEMSMESEMNITDEVNSSVIDNSPNHTLCTNSSISTTNKTEYAMLIGKSGGNVQEYASTNVENGSPYFLPNTFGTLAYAKDAVSSASLSNVTEKSGFLAGMQ